MKPIFDELLKILMTAFTTNITLKSQIMKRTFMALILIPGIFLIGCKQSDRGILEKTVRKLNSLDKIEYKAARTLKDINLRYIDTIQCYFDYEKNDTLVGAKYQFVSNRFEEIYNGKTEFSVNKNLGLILFNNQPTKETFNNSLFMSNSIHCVKQLLPVFLKDTSATVIRQNDTIINGEKNYNFKISFKNPYKIFDVIKRPRSVSDFILIVSQKSHIPTQMTYIFVEDKGTMKTEFSDITFTASRPDSIWNHVSYTEEFTRMTYKDWEENNKTRISGQVGEKAPDWKLPSMSGDSIQLSGLKNNLVLLEFWFPYCSGCLESIPHLNEIQDIYSKKGLKIYGIEYTKFKGDGLAEYIEKHKVKYPILHSGKLVKSWYGVYMAPAFFLIDKKGTIVYTSKGFDKNGLIKAIKGNI